MQYPRMFNSSESVFNSEGQSSDHRIPSVAADIGDHSANTKQVASSLINLLIPPALVTIGVTCNTLTILTMRTKYFRHVSTSVYLKSGAFNDTLALLISLISHWIYVNFPSTFVRTDSSDVMCKFFNFYGSGNNDLGILITASMTAERALVIAYPFRAANVCSVNRAWKIFLIIFSVVVIKNCHYLFTSDMVPAERTDRLCDVFADEHGHAYEMFYSDVWPWIHMCYVALCGTAIVLSNCIILHNVRQSAADKYTGGHTWRHLLPMLLGESFLLIVLTFPFTIHLALLAIRLKYDSAIYSDEEKASTENLIFSITFYMLYSNKCANFFMYCATGSRFRDGLRMILMACICKKKKIRMKLRSTISTLSNKTFKKNLRESKNKLNNSDTSSSESYFYNYAYDGTELSEKTQKSVSVYI